MLEGKKDVVAQPIDGDVLAKLRQLQESDEPDIVTEVCELYVKHAPEKISAIEKAAENGDAKGLQIAAHSLKSSSSYVGAMKLAEICRELEQMGRSGLMDNAKDKTKSAKVEYFRVISALQFEIELAKQSSD